MELFTGLPDLCRILGVQESCLSVSAVSERCRVGDMWQAGRHRLYVGDWVDYIRLAGNFQPDVVCADPPYGISLKTDWTNSRDYSAVIGDTSSFDPQPLLSLAPTVFLWGANHYAHLLPPSSFWICWDKQGQNLHRDHSDCEFCWCNLAKPARVFRHVWDGFRRDSERGIKRFHPTQKPMAVIEWLLEWSKGDIVFDPYLGSGTTVLACERLGRTCVGCEIEPSYGDVVLYRAEQNGLSVRLLERSE